MTSDEHGFYTNAYTYGLDRISEDSLTAYFHIWSDSSFYLYDGRGSVAQVANIFEQVTDKYNYNPYGEVKHGGF